MTEYLNDKEDIKNKRFAERSYEMIDSHLSENGVNSMVGGDLIAVIYVKINTYAIPVACEVIPGTAVMPRTRR